MLRLHVVPCVVLHADLQEWRDGLLVDCRSRGQELDLEGTIRLILLHNVLESWRLYGNNRIPSYQLLDGRIPFGEYVVLLKQEKRLLIYRPKSPAPAKLATCTTTCIRASMMVQISPTRRWQKGLCFHQCYRWFRACYRILSCLSDPPFEPFHAKRIYRLL